MSAENLGGKSNLEEGPESKTREEDAAMETQGREIETETDRTALKDEENYMPTSGDRALSVAACSFISSMAEVPSVRLHLLNDDNFIKSSEALATDAEIPDLQFEALKVVARLSKGSSASGALSPDRAGHILQSALSVTPDSQYTSARFSINALLILAAEGIEFVFDDLPATQQQTVLKELGNRYTQVLKSQAIVRSATKSLDLKKGGELAYNLTNIFMMSSCKDHLDECFDAALITSLVKTVQWRYDPKTVISQEDMCYWDATTTQSLQILARVLSRDEAKLQKSGLLLRGIAETVLMVARPGKAPRKAIDFPSSLSVASKHGEAAAVLAAKRVAKCIGL